MRAAARRALIAAATLALAGAGCGLGAGSRPGGVSLVISQDFGAHVLHDLNAPRVVGQDTVLRLLERNARVSTRYGGDFVQSIDGRSGGTTGGRPFDWFYYVNGVEASRGAADTVLRPGDRVWWDRHDWGTAMSVTAVVGSYPEPFLHGAGHGRLPVRVECAPGASAACQQVASRLASLGIPAGQGALGAGVGTGTLRVVVGAWAQLRHDPVLGRLEQGPSVSGVFARPGLRTLTLLGPTGASAGTLRAGAGLVAALSASDRTPVWAVTGTDGAGVAMAARSLDPTDLHNRFAVAVRRGRDLALPVQAR